MKDIFIAGHKVIIKLDNENSNLVEVSLYIVNKQYSFYYSNNNNKNIFTVEDIDVNKDIYLAYIYRNRNFITSNYIQEELFEKFSQDQRDIKILKRIVELFSYCDKLAQLVLK